MDAHAGAAAGALEGAEVGQLIGEALLAVWQVAVVLTGAVVLCINERGDIAPVPVRGVSVRADTALVLVTAIAVLRARIRVAARLCLLLLTRTLA